MGAAAIMFQGTGSDVGKSLIVAGLARAYTRRGICVRPFKPQNMSNNAAVTADGGEIGRAQALQARACGAKPSVHMNPVLLKPQSDVGAQVVLQGRVWVNAKPADYHRLKPSLLPKVLESFACLRQAADLVLVEGAGSPAEVNLRAGDIANMGFATAASVPVLLIGDIDRGGVIASVVGTQALLEPAERERLKGVIINKLRGDPRLFDDGLAVIRARTGLDCLGVIPHFEPARRLPAEDVMALPGSEKGTVPFIQKRGLSPFLVRIAVPLLPRISNFDDLDPLRLEPDVAVDMVAPSRPLPADADLIILPGSKSTIADLAFLRQQGWHIDIAAHVRRGGHVLGLCGGYQMLGRRIADPEGIEGTPGAVDGLALLDLETELTDDKTLVEVEGEDIASGAPVAGYEMHVGRTSGPALARPMLRLADGEGLRTDGALSADGRVAGCYVHGLFARDAFRRIYLARLKGQTTNGIAYEQEIETTLDALADHLAAHLDLDRILEIARAG
jgi:adenosylcobyric acid synthase